MIFHISAVIDAHRKIIPTSNILDQTASIVRMVFDNPKFVNENGALSGVDLMKTMADQYFAVIDNSELSGRDSIPGTTLGYLMDVVGKAGMQVGVSLIDSHFHALFAGVALGTVATSENLSKESTNAVIHAQQTLLIASLQNGRLFFKNSACIRSKSNTSAIGF